MPIKVQSDLPVRAILEQENIFVMDENRALSQKSFWGSRRFFKP